MTRSDALPSKSAIRDRAKIIGPGGIAPTAWCLEVSRRSGHVAQLLDNLGLDRRLASAWVLAFCDEADPLMVLPSWIHAGWRDPLVVGACLKILETREASEQAFDLLDWDLSRSWDPSIPDALLEVASRL